jgi:hypothetical protein
MPGIHNITNDHSGAIFCISRKKGLVSVRETELFRSLFRQEGLDGFSSRDILFIICL